MEGKSWGVTTTLVKSPMMELHKIKVAPWSKCSLHKHDMKINLFIVFSGRLFIEIHKNSYDLIDITELNEGDIAAAYPGEFHCFKTEHLGAEALEIYYPAPLSSDIVRKVAAGPNL